MIRFISTWFNKGKMLKYVQNEGFCEYPNLWSDNSSCAYGNELIHYLNRKEFLFKDILIETYVNNDNVDILSIDGIAHSKSDLNHSNFYQFSLLLNEQGPIKFTTSEDFIDNITWLENRFEKWIVEKQTWNKKIYIINPDGSHHLAAVYRQCREQGREYALPSRIYHMSVNHEKLSDLLNNYYLLFSHKKNLYKIYKEYRNLYGNQCDELILYELNSKNRYLVCSHILALKKTLDFNEFLIELLLSYDKEFLLLNNRIELLK